MMHKQRRTVTLHRSIDLVRETDRMLLDVEDQPAQRFNVVLDIPKSLIASLAQKCPYALTALRQTTADT
jgi:hypothetical protein